MNQAIRLSIARAIFVLICGATVTGCSKPSTTAIPNVVPPSNPADAKIDQLQRQLASVQARIRQLQASAYASDPKLAEARKKLDDLEVQQAEFEKGLGKQVTQFLADEKKKSGDNSTTDNLELLEMQWVQVRNAQIANDPQSSQYMRVTRVSDPVLMNKLAKQLQENHPELKDTDLSDPAKFWPAYRDVYIQKLPGLLQAADTAGQTFGLPQFARDWARQKAVYEVDPEFLQGFIEATEPPNLQKARDEEYALKDQLSAFGFDEGN